LGLAKILSANFLNSGLTLDGAPLSNGGCGSYSIAIFGPRNKISVVGEGEGGIFNRSSFFFREDKWSEDEMAKIMYEVSKRSIHYILCEVWDKFFKFV
jgi:hypothetical protein